MKAIRTRPFKWATATLLTCLLSGPMATTLRAQLGDLGGLGGVTIGGSSSTTASTSTSASYRGRATVAAGTVSSTTKARSISADGNRLTGS